MELLSLQEMTEEEIAAEDQTSAPSAPPAAPRAAASIAPARVTRLEHARAKPDSTTDKICILFLLFVFVVCAYHRNEMTQEHQQQRKEALTQRIDFAHAQCASSQRSEPARLLYCDLFNELVKKS
jgi:hypothetical protein